jgi:hypothetical protein
MLSKLMLGQNTVYVFVVDVVKIDVLVVDVLELDVLGARRLVHWKK